MRWPPASRPAQIVAESLQSLPFPEHGFLLEALVPARAAAAAIARALEAPRAAEPPPEWLRPAQHEAFSRAVGAVRTCGGAMLAEPVGAGKTWIALAVARCLASRAVCLVPSPLVDQWSEAAARAGVPIVSQTHEAWSRRSRDLPAGLIVVDESHRFRNPLTRRYRHLAPALVGRQVLLLTATPVVNRLDDLAAQLALAIPDDVLAPSGSPSLTALLRTGQAPAALDRVVIRSIDPAGRPVALHRTLVPDLREEEAARTLVRQLDRLRLSTDPATAALVRGVLLAALASSPAALRAAIHRYHDLLLQHLDAARDGRQLGRRVLRRALLGEMDQLVWWPLLGLPEGDSDLAPADLPRLRRLLERLPTAAGPDPRVERLALLLADGRPTVVFTGFRATVHHLRRWLTPRSRVAWCSGGEAGIGTSRIPRGEVLTWFRPGASHRHPELGPTVLVTTDLASEGLNLQRAARVVHYDLPWTAVRMEQRAGRVVRPGSLHRSAEVVRFDLPAILERRLGRSDAIARKALLPGRLGLDRAAEAWSWRRRCLARVEGAIAARGLCQVTGPREFILAAVEFRTGQQPVGSQVLVHLPGQGWTEAGDQVESALALVLAARRSWPLDRAGIRRELASLHRWLGAGRLPRQPDPVAGAAIRQVQRLGLDAARARQANVMELATRALRFLAGGMTAGERDLVARIGAADPGELAGLLRLLPEPHAGNAGALPRLIGMIRMTGGAPPAAARRPR